MSCCSPNKKQASAPKQNSCCAPSPDLSEREEKQDSGKNGCCSSNQSNREEQNNSETESENGCCSAPKKNREPCTITRTMTIEEILGMFPHKAQRLSQEITNAGLHCIGCHAAVWETLEGGMFGHGKSDEEIEELVRRLNALLSEKSDFTTITVTPRGAAKFLEILAEEGKPGWGMRFSEEMAGCNGFEHVLDFSEKADEEDQIFLSSGIEIHVKKALVPRLVGSQIDYVEGLRGAGFKISNPNVSSACGCGTSHNY